MQCFFDLGGDGDPTIDNAGTECSSIMQMRKTALSLLTEVAAHESHESDRHRLTVRVRNQEGTDLYCASLIIEGSVLEPF